MIKDLKREVELIESNCKISDKLIVLSAYFDLYNKVVKCNPNMDIDELNRVESKLESIFEETVKKINYDYNRAMVSSSCFMNCFIDLLKNSSIFPHNLDNVEDSLVESNEYIKLIDKYPFDLKTKAEMMEIYNDYLNYVNSNLINKYGKRDSKTIRNGLSDTVLNKLNIYLAECSTSKKYNFYEMNSNLKLNTKNYLIDLLKSNPDIFKCFIDKDEETIYNSLSDSKRNLYLILCIYELSGYIVHGYPNNKIVRKEICDEFDISKSKYLIDLLSMLISTAKFTKNNEIDSHNKKIK